MREYYARFFREVWRQVFVFWKSQIGVSLAAGIIAATVNAIRQEDAPTVAFWAIGVAAIGYLTILGIFSICAGMCAPVRLDRERALEIQTKDSELKQKAAHVLTLEEVLSRKHPADEQKEQIVRDALADFSPDARRFIGWLLTAGEVPPLRFRNSQVGVNEMNEALTKGRERTLIKDRKDGPSGNHYSRINEELKDAIRDVLHPPPRPVTPSQA